jgi:hypothetical protein
MSLKVPQFPSIEHFDYSQLRIDLTKEILVVFSDDNTSITIEFMDKVFHSVDKNLEKEVQLLRVDPNKLFHLGRLLSNSSFQTVFFFGIQPSDMGMGIVSSLFEKIAVGQFCFVSLPSLTQVIEDKSFKIKLWNLLKIMYSVQ